MAGGEAADGRQEMQTGWLDAFRDGDVRSFSTAEEDEEAGRRRTDAKDWRRLDGLRRSQCKRGARGEDGWQCGPGVDKRRVWSPERINPRGLAAEDNVSVVCSRVRGHHEDLEVISLPSRKSAKARGNWTDSSEGR